MIDTMLILSVIENEDDRNEIGAIFERHSQNILNFILSTVHNEDDAQDILSIVFLRVVRYYENFLDKDDLYIKGLLICFARSVIIQNWRKGRNIDVKLFSELENDSYISSDGEEYGYSYEENIPDQYELQVELINRENIKLITDEMNKLRMTDRDYCIMYYHYGFKIRESAKLYNSNESSVSTVINRFRKKIKDKLEDLYGKDQ